MKVFSAEELLPWLLSGPAPQDFSAFGEYPALVLDLSSLRASDEPERLAAWLPTLACPVIGLRGQDAAYCREPQFGPAIAACDTVVDSEEDARQLWDKIAACPLAAASFVDLLRVTENMPLEAALSVESAVYATLQGGPEYARWLKEHGGAEAPPADAGPPVILEREGSRLDLTLNRPSNLNAMSNEIRDALVEAFRMVMLEPEIDSVHLYGRGRSFSTGGDLSEFGTVPDTASGHVIRLLSVPGKFLAAVADKSTAHLHGACVGSGIEFPAFARRVIAHEKTWFKLPEVGMGLIPGAGGCISMARRMGRQRLAWMGLSGKRVRAQQALTWGLVDEISAELSEGAEH